MDLEIRPATANDLDAIAALEAQCFPPSEADSREMIAARSNLIAIVNARVVGYINAIPTSAARLDDRFYSPKPPIEPNADGLALMSVGVDPNFRRRGIAAKLLSEMLRQSQKKFAVLVCKRDKIEYYSRFGFQCVGISAVTLGNQQWHDMILYTDWSE